MLPVNACARLCTSVPKHIVKYIFGCGITLYTKWYTTLIGTFYILCYKMLSCIMSMCLCYPISNAKCEAIVANCLDGRTMK